MWAENTDWLIIGKGMASVSYLKEENTFCSVIAFCQVKCLHYQLWYKGQRQAITLKYQITPLRGKVAEEKLIVADLAIGKDVSTAVHYLIFSL